MLLAISSCSIAKKGFSNMEDVGQKTNQKFVIAIDVGTSGTKIGLIDLEGNVIAKASERYQTYFLPDGGAEQDPNDWWHAVSTGVKHIVRSEVNPTDICDWDSSQWAVTVPVDDQHPVAQCNQLDGLAGRKIQ
jgi:xylulokinase